MSSLKASMHTPWGLSQDAKFLGPKSDVVVVSTASHGGIGVARTRPVYAAFAAMAIPTQDWLWFEEDCAACAPVLMFPELFPANQGIARDTLRNWYPEAYALFYGEMPTAAESHVVRERALQRKHLDNFLVSAGFGPWAWDVPAGFVYAEGIRKTDGATAGFLVPQNEYRDTLVLDAYPRWSPNRDLPYSKPRAERVAATA